MLGSRRHPSTHMVSQDQHAQGSKRIRNPSAKVRYRISVAFTRRYVLRGAFDVVAITIRTKKMAILGYSAAPILHFWLACVDTAAGRRRAAEIWTPVNTNNDIINAKIAISAATIVFRKRALE